MDWVILLSIIAIAAWWLYRKETQAKLAPLVMNKWVEMAQTAAVAADAGNGAALVGKSVTVSDFRYEFGGVPPMLKVSVSGTGSYLGFRGDIHDDGTGWVWVEDGCRPGAKKLVAALCSAYPDLVNGNKFSSFARDFVKRFADPNVPVRLPPTSPQASHPPQPPQPFGASVSPVTTPADVPPAPQTAAANSPPQPIAFEGFSLRGEWGSIVLVVIVLLVRFWPQISSWIEGLR